MSQLDRHALVPKVCPEALNRLRNVFWVMYILISNMKDLPPCAIQVMFLTAYCCNRSVFQFIILSWWPRQFQQDNAVIE